MKFTLRTPAGTWHPRLTIAEIVFLKTWPSEKNPRGRWRVLRERKGAAWDLATRDHLVATLLAAWKRRDYVPHEAWR